MKTDIGELAEPFGGNVVAVFAGILLFFPGLASVLCVAPGLHVEIEGIGAACCSTSGISAPGEQLPRNGLSASGDCGDCTDIFLTQDGRGAVLESHGRAASGLPADESSRSHISGGTSPLLPRPAAANSILMPACTPSSFPLRC